MPGDKQHLLTVQRFARGRVPPVSAVSWLIGMLIGCLVQRLAVGLKQGIGELVGLSVRQHLLAVIWSCGYG